MEEDQNVPETPAQWSVKQVANWLAETVGLGHYRESFEGNDINGQCLLQLTKEDLKTELGVASLGHRLAIIKAIQILKGGIGGFSSNSDSLGNNRSAGSDTNPSKPTGTEPITEASTNSTASNTNTSMRRRKKRKLKKVGSFVASLDEKLGKGGFSSVFKGWRLPPDFDGTPDIREKEQQEGTEREDDQESFENSVPEPTYEEDLVAIKIMERMEMTSALLKRVQAEIDLFKSLHHPNIVAYLGHFEEDEKFYIVMEYLPKTLHQLIYQRRKLGGKFSPKEIVQVAHGVAQGMWYLHSMERPVIHRDLKSHNVLIRVDALSAITAVKLCDFGVSKVLSESGMANTHHLGTFRWMAPEVMHSFGDYTCQVDVWSFGMLLYEMLALQVPYYDLVDQNDIFRSIQNSIMPRLPRDIMDFPIYQPYIILMNQCLKRNPSQRPTSLQLAEKFTRLEMEIRKEIQKSSESVGVSDSTIPAQDHSHNTHSSSSVREIEGPGCAVPDVDTSGGGHSHGSSAEGIGSVGGVLGGSACGEGEGGSDVKEMEETPPPVYGNSWAIIIGCDHYQNDDLPDIVYAVNDATRLKEYLQSLGFSIFVFLNSDATKEAIEYCLGDSLKWKVSSYDRVLVFFAGHIKSLSVGGSESEEIYLLPYDADPNRLVSKGISMEALRYFSKHIPAKHLLFIIDACASLTSAAVFEIRRPAHNDFTPTTNDLNTLIQHMREETVQVLTAGCVGQQFQIAQPDATLPPPEDGQLAQRTTSTFLRLLLEALQGGVFVNDCEWVSTQQLASWLQVAVAKETGNAQFPQFDKRHSSGKGQFIFFKPYPVPALPPEPALEIPNELLAAGIPAADMVIKTERTEEASVLSFVDTVGDNTGVNTQLDNRAGQPEEEDEGEAEIHTVVDAETGGVAVTHTLGVSTKMDYLLEDELAEEPRESQRLQHPRKEALEKALDSVPTLLRQQTQPDLLLPLSPTLATTSPALTAGPKTATSATTTTTTTTAMNKFIPMAAVVVPDDDDDDDVEVLGEVIVLGERKKAKKTPTTPTAKPRSRATKSKAPARAKRTDPWDNEAEVIDLSGTLTPKATPKLTVQFLESPITKPAPAPHSAQTAKQRKENFKLELELNSPLKGRTATSSKAERQAEWNDENPDESSMSNSGGLMGDTEEVHMNYVCDGCEMRPIRGVRHNCMMCDDKDLCGECMQRFSSCVSLREIPETVRECFRMKHGWASIAKAVRDDRPIKKEIQEYTFYGIDEDYEDEDEDDRDYNDEGSHEEDEAEEVDFEDLEANEEEQVPATNKKGKASNNKKKTLSKAKEETTTSHGQKEKENTTKRQRGRERKTEGKTGKGGEKEEGEKNRDRDRSRSRERERVKDPRSEREKTMKRKRAVNPLQEESERSQTTAATEELRVAVTFGDSDRRGGGGTRGGRGRTTPAIPVSTTTTRRSVTLAKGKAKKRKQEKKMAMKREEKTPPVDSDFDLDESPFSHPSSQPSSQQQQTRVPQKTSSLRSSSDGLATGSKVYQATIDKEKEKEKRPPLPSMAILCCSPLATKEDLPRKVLEEIEKYEIPVKGGTEDDEDDEDAVLAPPATLNAFLEEWTCLEQTLKRTGKAMKVRMEFATPKNVQAVISQEHEILHYADYSGYLDRSTIAFETEKGEIQVLDDSELIKLVCTANMAAGSSQVAAAASFFSPASSQPNSPTCSPIPPFLPSHPFFGQPQEREKEKESEGDAHVAKEHETGRASQTQRGLKLVFVSGRNARTTGEAFLKAGVPHVIVLESELNSPISERIKLRFTQAFYTALFGESDTTLLAAFKTARAIVQSEVPSLRARRDAIVLLPLDDNSPRTSATASPSLSPSPTPPLQPPRSILAASASSNQLSVIPFHPHGNRTALTQSMLVSLNTDQGGIARSQVAEGLALGAKYHDVMIFPQELSEGKCEFLTTPPKKELPQLPKHFITRPKEMKAMVVELLNSNNRIVNLTGSLGVGKTTLTLAVGHFLAERKLFGDGVFFVELNNFRSRNIMAYTVARSFGLSVNTPEELFAELQNKGECLVILKVRAPLADDSNALTGNTTTPTTPAGKGRPGSGGNGAKGSSGDLEFTELHLFLKDLLRKTRRGLKLLISSRQPIDFSSTMLHPTSPDQSLLGGSSSGKEKQRENAGQEEEEEEEDMEVQGMDEFGLKRIFDVGSFSRQHSRMLLKSMAPHLGKFSKDIAQMFGHLPLALKLVASAFAQQGVGGDDEVEQLLRKESKQISKSADDGRLIEFAISKSYQIMPPAAREHLLALSVFPTAFTLPAASAVLGFASIKEVTKLEAAAQIKTEEQSATRVKQPTPRKELVLSCNEENRRQTKRVLRQLLSYDLLSFHGANKQYYFHDSVLLFSRKKVKDLLQGKEIEKGKNEKEEEKLEKGKEKEQEQEQEKELFSPRTWQKRYVEYYLYLLSTVDQQYYEGNAEGIKAFDLERQNIDDAMKLAELSDQHVFCKFALAGHHIFCARLKVSERVQLYNTVVGIASSVIKDEELEALLLSSLGYALERSGDWNGAEKTYIRCRDLLEKKFGKTHPEMAEVLKNLGLVYLHLKKHDKRLAARLFFEALEIREKVLGENHPETGKICNIIGSYYRTKKDYGKAERFFNRALKILVKGLQRRENVFVARVMNNLGLLYRDMGKDDLAEKKFEECVEIWKKSDHPDVAQPLVNLANLYKDKRRYVEAAMLYNEALDGCRRSGDPLSMGITLFGLAVNCLEQGDTERGEKYLWDVLRIYEQQFVDSRADYRFYRPLKQLYQLYSEQGRWEDIEGLKQKWPAISFTSSSSAANRTPLPSLSPSQSYSSFSPFYMMSDSGVLPSAPSSSSPSSGGPAKKRRFSGAARDTNKRGKRQRKEEVAEEEEQEEQRTVGHARRRSSEENNTNGNAVAGSKRRYSAPPDIGGEGESNEDGEKEEQQIPEKEMGIHPQNRKKQKTAKDKKAKETGRGRGKGRRGRGRRRFGNKNV